MNKIHIVTPHALGKEEALKRVKAFIETAKGQMGAVPNAPKGDFSESWDGYAGEFEFKAQGMSVSGTVVVADASVDLTVKLPLAAMFFKSKLEGPLAEGMKAMLA